MIKQFNMILRKFGGHRVRLREMSFTIDTPVSLEIVILGWGSFLIDQHGLIQEWNGQHWQMTDRSRHLQNVSLGKTRNDEGVVA